jgi:hypothetical protein
MSIYVDLQADTKDWALTHALEAERADSRPPSRAFLEAAGTLARVNRQQCPCSVKPRGGVVELSTIQAVAS